MMMMIIAVLLRLLVCFPLDTGGAQTILKENCPNATIYSSNSPYKANLDNLLSVLSSKATNNINGFYNFTAGDNLPNIAYGLFLCRGDLSLEVCHNCVATAAVEIVGRCPYQKEATVWYDKCMLRYSNRSIFSLMDISIQGVLRNVPRETDPNRTFGEILGNSIMQIAANASVGIPGKKFATSQVSYTPSQTLYGLAQCTPDLTSMECNNCLQSAISRYLNCCNGNQGWAAVSPSCNIRYDSHRFYGNNDTRVSPPSPGKKRNIRIAITIVVSLSVLVALIMLSYYVYGKRKRRTEKANRENQGVHLLHLAGGSSGSQEHTDSAQDFPFIKLDIICSATNQFSFKNKLGQGGFGPVYKGILPDGKAIAVKRLSKTSGQGLQEFRNEISLIARLQHRNLVRLLGCCLEENELLLIYEYMPNKSLNFFLFDSKKGVELHWTRRFIIIKGIARGILYLHEDSRLRIIHRDLKASNVLLDQEMNPKISDFGLARIFGVNQDEANTNRVVGTYGYMAPEYAMEGLFSVKSDVFSFGVILLEIISGKKNTGYVYDNGHNLLSFAWKLWSEGQGLELLDPVMKESAVEDQVLKCIHIGLLCVQDEPSDRPTMSLVVVMLASDTVTLPQPNKPMFPVGRQLLNSPRSSLSNVGMVSENEITISTVSPR